MLHKKFIQKIIEAKGKVIYAKTYDYACKETDEYWLICRRFDEAEGWKKFIKIPKNRWDQPLRWTRYFKEADEKRQFIYKPYL